MLCCVSLTVLIKHPPLRWIVGVVVLQSPVCRVINNFSFLSYFSLDSGDIVFTQLTRWRGLLAWTERENVTKQQTREGGGEGRDFVSI